MLNIIIILCLLYIFYRFFLGRLVKNLTDRYLQVEKEKFYKNNSNIVKPLDDDENEISNKTINISNYKKPKKSLFI